MRGALDARGGNEPADIARVTPSAQKTRSARTPSYLGEEKATPESSEEEPYEDSGTATLRVRCQTCGRQDTEGLPSLDEELSDLVREQRLFDALIEEC